MYRAARRLSIFLILALTGGCASSGHAVRPESVQKVSQARDASKIYGDEALNRAFEEWAEAGYPTPRGTGEYDLDGKASWYGPGLNGNHTANGEIFDMYGMTAAHKELPFESIVVVTNEQNGKSVVVRINDRGPFVRGRVIDMSYGAAYLLDMIHSGVVPVSIEVIRLGTGK